MALVTVLPFESTVIAFVAVLPVELLYSSHITRNRLSFILIS